jgi:hypothetical protein
MKKFLFLTLLLAPLIAYADTFLVWQFTESVRVVLKQTPGNCKKGNQAAAQRMDGAYIPGCWVYEPNPELIRITWHNGDFAILRIKDFTTVKE